MKIGKVAYDAAFLFGDKNSAEICRDMLRIKSL